MSRPPKSQDSIGKFILMVFTAPLVLLALLYICFAIFAVFSFQPSPKKRVLQTINLTLLTEKSYYLERGKFTENYDELAIGVITNDSPKKPYDFQLRDLGDNFIVVARHESPQDDIEKTTFGTIQVLKSQEIRQLNTKSQWQYLEIVSSICQSEKLGTPLPSDLQLASKADRCPIGYKLSDRKVTRSHQPQTNINFVLVEQRRTYKSKGKFTKNITETPNFIKVNPEQYDYRIQTTPKQIIVSAQPKSFQDPRNWTYLAISKVDRSIKNKDSQITNLYCESEKQNIPIPTSSELDKIDKGCPVGYKQHHN
jgi:hypothetical protein